MCVNASVCACMGAVFERVCVHLLCLSSDHSWFPAPRQCLLYASLPSACVTHCLCLSLVPLTVHVSALMNTLIREVGLMMRARERRERGEGEREKGESGREREGREGGKERGMGVGEPREA